MLVLCSLLLVAILRYTPVADASCSGEQISRCRDAVAGGTLDTLDVGGKCVVKTYVAFTHMCNVNFYLPHLDHCCCALETTRALCCRYHNDWSTFRCVEHSDVIDWSVNQRTVKILVPIAVVVACVCVAIIVACYRHHRKGKHFCVFGMTCCKPRQQNCRDPSSVPLTAETDRQINPYSHQLSVEPSAPHVSPDVIDMSAPGSHVTSLASQPIPISYCSHHDAAMMSLPVPCGHNGTPVTSHPLQYDERGVTQYCPQVQCVSCHGSVSTPPVLCATCQLPPPSYAESRNHRLLSGTDQDTPPVTEPADTQAPRL